MTATPEQRREAWLALMQDMERNLIATKLNAEGQVHIQARGTDEWEATAWAADKLLGQLQAIPAPVVPVDDAKGQGTLEELAPSTPGENPVEEEDGPSCMDSFCTRRHSSFGQHFREVGP